MANAGLLCREGRLAGPDEAQPGCLEGHGQGREVEGREDRKPAKAAPDDLTQISGIGPRMATILGAGGVTTYAQLQNTSTEKLHEIVAASGAVPSASIDTWPTQASYASKGDWSGLASYNGRHK